LLEGLGNKIENKKMKTTTFGIDHMAFAAPSRYLALEDLAAARKVNPLKYTVGIGISEAAVATPAEDVVVLAANAGQRVLEEAGISPGDIGLLIIGTESAEDKSKPTATHVHQLLGINPACRVYDIVHACAGATYGVLSAIDWLQDPGHKYALVIASDIARYGKNTLGEPTQGAGAVAMLVSRSPRLIELSEASAFSKSVYDFWKPLDQKYPLVDGIFSAQCYAEAAEACFQGSKLSEKAAYIYHVPYPKLVQQTHSRIARMIRTDIDDIAHYRDNVEASCRYSSRIGNIYTGSLWLGLMSFFSNQGNVDKFDGCYLFSYGAGCGAALLRGRFSAAWAEQTAYFGFDKFFEQRQRISMEEYEDLVTAYEHPEKVSDDVRNQINIGGRFRYMGNQDNKRVYGPTQVLTT
jgi:hydroxymethylglutaryl-CoA synthase